MKYEIQEMKVAIKIRPVPHSPSGTIPLIENPNAGAVPVELIRNPVGRPRSGKNVVSLRLDPEVIAKFRATGPGWQARMNDVLKAAKV